MDKKSELQAVIQLIEENLRASKRAGLLFEDPRNFRSRILNKQNHVVFGRRGAGKTSLLSSLGDEDVLVVNINMEDYKTITFPNIILRCMIDIFKSIRLKSKQSNPWYTLSIPSFFFRNKLKGLIDELESLIHEPDETIHEERYLRSQKEQDRAALKARNADLSTGSSTQSETEVSRKVSKNKLNFLRLEFAKYKDALEESVSHLRGMTIFILLDDFYFVKKKHQPNLVDYVHRLCKGLNIFVKIATIKHRTKLYSQRGDEYVGVEVGHDVQEIDMDYTLDKFDDLRRFMKQLLNNAAAHCGQGEIEIEDLFAGEGFNQLCLASGGVPRDFLALFVILANQYMSKDIPYIGKVEVTEAAIANINNKYSSMRDDSSGERDVLEIILDRIKQHVYNTNRTNAFLVSKSDLAEYPEERQIIKELVDLRLIHLIDENTSKAPSDGLRYEAYMLDVGLYENSRPRKFNQVQPGSRDEKSRKDNLRSSPKLELDMLGSIIDDEDIRDEIEVSEF